MTFEEIMHYTPVNKTDNEKVMKIAESIKQNGFVGCPILVSELFGALVTGSHRLSAITYLYENDEDNYYGDLECAENVDDILNEYCEKNDICFDEIDFGRLGEIFEGTWVEDYKNEIAEW